MCRGTPPLTNYVDLPCQPCVKGSAAFDLDPGTNPVVHDTGEWHAADMTDCAKGLPWPVVDRVRMLGLPGSIDESSVTFEIMTPGKIHPLRTIPIKASKVCQSIPHRLLRSRFYFGDLSPIYSLYEH
jgi:hypothetical protein